MLGRTIWASVSNKLGTTNSFNATTDLAIAHYDESIILKTDSPKR